MKRRDLLGAGLLVALVGLPVWGADEPGGIPAEDLSPWEWYADVRLTTGTRPKYCDLVVPPPVFSRAKTDLSDLRLIDQQGRPVPYALRVLRGQTESRTLDARSFNQAFNAETGVAEVTLDLGPNPPEHNSITIDTAGTNYRRAVRLEGSADQKKWVTVLDKVWLIHFGTDTGVVDQRRFNYPPSRFQYLRVQVTRDRSLPTDELKIEGVQVQWTVRIPGEMTTLPATLEPRQPVPGIGGPGSAWFISLGESVPVEKLTFDVNDSNFVRPFQLELANPGEPVRVVARGEWRRQGPEGQREEASDEPRARDRGNEARKPLEVSFPEVVGQRFRLLVTDYRNPSLSLTRATAAAPVRQVIFTPPADLAGQPLKLYLGNPQAQPPHYDFASTLPARLDIDPVRVTVGNVQPNPNYHPQPKPWTERMPWLVDAVLAGAAVVLLAILLLLARSAVRRYSPEVSDGPSAVVTRDG
jgi:hypothetical protein